MTTFKLYYQQMNTKVQSIVIYKYTDIPKSQTNFTSEQHTNQQYKTQFTD